MQHQAALFVLHCIRSFLMNVLMYCGTGWGTAQWGLGRKFSERRIPDEAGFLFWQFFLYDFYELVCPTPTKHIIHRQFSRSGGAPMHSVCCAPM